MKTIRLDYWHTTFKETPAVLSPALAVATLGSDHRCSYLKVMPIGLPARRSNRLFKSSPPKG